MNIRKLLIPTFAAAMLAAPLAFAQDVSAEAQAEVDAAAGLTVGGTRA